MPDIVLLGVALVLIIPIVVFFGGALYVEWKTNKMFDDE